LIPEVISLIIQILIVFVYIANFKEAWHQRVETESSATENDTEEPKNKSKNCQRSSSEDDSDFEGIPTIFILLLFI